MRRCPLVATTYSVPRERRYATCALIQIKLNSPDAGCWIRTLLPGLLRAVSSFVTPPRNAPSTMVWGLRHPMFGRWSCSMKQAAGAAQQGGLPSNRCGAWCGDSARPFTTGLARRRRVDQPRFLRTISSSPLLAKSRNPASVAEASVLQVLSLGSRPRGVREAKRLIEPARVAPVSCSACRAGGRGRSGCNLARKCGPRVVCCSPCLDEDCPRRSHWS